MVVVLDDIGKETKKNALIIHSFFVITVMTSMDAIGLLSGGTWLAHFSLQTCNDMMFGCLN